MGTVPILLPKPIFWSSQPFSPPYHSGLEFAPMWKGVFLARFGPQSVHSNHALITIPRSGSTPVSIQTAGMVQQAMSSTGLGSVRSQTAASI